MMTADAQRMNALRAINFPVLEHISIQNYLMYPGTPDTPDTLGTPGIDHSFKPGMNVIVGINGVGKTTLLNILLRMLTGDKDLRAEKELGDSQRKLANIDTDIFSARVPDRAKNAEATLRFRLGTHNFVIKRSLRNLEVLDFDMDPPDPWLDQINDKGDRYKAAVTRHSGVDDFFDFVLILQYLMFFLQDRRTLVWDENAQFEIFRILFCPENITHNYKEELNSALSADSYARNMSAILSREKKRLNKARNEVTNANPSELAMLESAATELKKLIEEKASAADKLDRKRRELRQTLEKNRNDVERLHQQERQLRESMLASLFPKLSDYGSFALANIFSEHACIVCGNEDTAHLAQVRAKLEATSDCPLCHADISLQESHTTTDINEENKRQLEDLVSERKKYSSGLDTLETEIKAMSKTYLALEEERWAAESEYNDINQKLVIVRRALEGAGNSDLQETTKRLLEFERTIVDYRAEKNSALYKILEVVDGVVGNVELFKDDLIRNFGVFIDAFMAERCELTYRRESRNIGQLSSPVELLYPEFRVNLTSGVYKQSGSAREASSAVSESQMEFIELAFRMSLLATAASTDAVTLVMETPEASLDAVFIPRAGASLNKFAHEATRCPSTLITSSNLNGSEMIPALLGIAAPVPAPESDTAATHDNIWANDEIDTSKRVLNLLACAAKNAALEKFEDEYQYRFKLATERQSMTSS